ncbi:MAG: 3-dehydroquinate synthase [Planctomycetota bacterium]
MTPRPTEPAHAVSGGTWHQRRVSLKQPYRVGFTDDVWQPDNPNLAQAFALTDEERGAKALVVVDEAVLQADRHWRTRIDQRFVCGDLPGITGVLTLPGGEESKNETRHLDTVYRAMLEHGIDRRSYVLAIGGGALLDTVGYAAATMHRGVRLIRLPTTTLAQCDSGVGVKNAVNRFGVKNAVGTFAVPWAVINDTNFLRSLPDDIWRHGFAEAVKVALLKDAALFNWLEEHAQILAQRDEHLAQYAWRRSAELHMQHIAEAEPVGGGDPFEQRVARPLDFGHWSAHRLEELSNHALAHGPAVAIGLSVDLRYAQRLGLVARELADRAIKLIETLGLPTRHPLLAHPDLPAGLERFRQHLGGRLTLTMVRAVGNAIDVHEVDDAALDETLSDLAVAEAKPDTIRA